MRVFCVVSEERYNLESDITCIVHSCQPCSDLLVVGYFQCCVEDA